MAKSKYLRPAEDPNRWQLIRFSRNGRMLGLGFYAWDTSYSGFRDLYHHGIEGRIFLLFWSIDFWIRWGKT